VNIFSLKKIIVLLFLLIFNVQTVLAEQASTVIAVTLPSYIKIEALTGEVLTANITDRTGNMLSPLYSKFRVISNFGEPTTLYLKANTITEAGIEPAMFQRGGMVYIAFSNVAKRPNSESLVNCKYSTKPDSSPGVVAYPIYSISGAEYKFKQADDRYEVEVESGITDITVNIGNNVLKSTFASNDPNGFYQATLTLTEADI
jgi:hypothetical protein